MTVFQPLKFPENFLWGVATAAHQNEGNNTNNDFWAWEQAGHTHDGTISGLATDWWDAGRRRAEADFARAAEMGLNTLRLSLEWSRIEPEENRWDDAAIDRYRQLLTELRRLNITPMVTLHHFTNPLWLAARGGWLADDVVSRFERYAAHVVAALGDLVDLWCTINEPLVYAYLSHLVGDWSPGKHSFPQTFKIAARMALAHRAAEHAIHARQPQAQVGLVKHQPIFDPLRDNRADKLVSGWQETLFNRRMFEAVYENRLRFPLNLFAREISVGRDDFIGINYYGRQTVKFSLGAPFTLFGKLVAPPGAEMWDAPWADREIYPHGVYRVCRQAAKYKKPIFITENGFADAADTRRPRFLLTHLAALHRAIQSGADVRGYYYWTFVDNYEWVEGWSTRFGLVALNPETQERTPRRSAELYGEIARANAITPAMVEKFAPEAMASVFGMAGNGV